MMFGWTHAGLAIIALLLSGAFWWVSDFTERRNAVDCEAASEQRIQNQLDQKLAKQFPIGSTRGAFIESARNMELRCLSICADGSAGEACLPTPTERTSTHCRKSLYTDFCRHSLRVYGPYVDDTLVENLKVKAYSKKRSVASLWIE